MKSRPETVDGISRCEEIRPALFEYMTRELGSNRSELVREHLRHCHDCSLLHGASDGQTGFPDRLSEKRRERMLRAALHPVVDWVYVHHVGVSIVVAVVVVFSVAYASRKAYIWRVRPRPPSVSVRVVNTNEPMPAFPPSAGDGR